MLGPIEVVDDAGPVRLGGEKARALLAALLLERGRTVSTDALVHVVWERPPATAGHAVAVYVSRLRAAIGAACPGRETIFTRGAGYALEIDAEELDLERFRGHVERGRAAASSLDWPIAWEALGAAVEVWWHPTPLACLTTSPLVDVRGGLEDERLSALEDRFDAGLHLGLHGGVLSELRALTSDHPERERLWAALMLALYRSGRQAEALESFLDARKQLDTEFGVEPGPALRELQRRILEQDPALDLPRARATPIALPAPLSSFVGREQELDDAAGMLSDPDVRLLTIVGPGGIGKTRFAIELARRLADRFLDGVSWVGFDAVNDPSRVPAEIATAVVGRPVDNPIDELSRALRGKRTLLVLDCFEHVLEAATDLHRLLQHVPTLSVLATSRERLGLSGEHLHWLPPLTPVDAAVLFRTRSRAVSRSKRSASDLLVAEICERLDRLPLAIELVASQVDVETEGELLATLERSLDVDGRRDPPARHRTLRTTLDWSYALLREDLRRTLQRLSVFVGGFTAEAAEAVAGATRSDVDRLVGKSLVAFDPDARRYRLLDTIRGYALERLDQSGDADEIGGRHAAWFAGVARRLEPDTYISASASGYAAFASDLPNFRLALRWLVNRDDGHTASALVRALAPYLYTQLPAPDGRSIARSTLALPGSDSIDRGHVLYYDACVSMDMGLGDETRVALTEAESLFAAASDLRGLSLVHNLRCFHEATVGNYDVSRAAGEKACFYARQAGSKGLEEVAEAHLAYALLGLGAAGPFRDEDSLLRALELGRLDVDRAEVSENPYALVSAYGNLANTLVEVGELAEALSYVRRAIVLDREHGFVLPYAPMVAAVIAGRVGEHETAVRVLVPCLDDLSAKSVELQALTVGQVEEVFANARAVLGDEGYAATERAGRRTSLEEATELAMTLEVPADAPASVGEAC